MPPARRPLCGEITIEVRQVFGAYGAKGRWETTRGAPFPIRATVNPVPGDVLASLPEGERVGRQYRVLTNDVDLRPADDETGLAGDEVFYEGHWYEVRDRQVYPTVIPHSEYRVRRRQVAPLPTP